MNKVTPERAGSTEIRAHNRDLVLRLVWHAQTLSRSDIARQLGMSRSTVSAIVQDLCDFGLVKDVGRGLSSGGRRPVLLSFQDDAYSILGIDVGATHVAGVLTNLRGQIRVWQHQQHPVTEDPEGTHELIARICRALMASDDVSPQQLIGIGIAAPSPVNPSRPGELSPLYFPHWNGHDLATGARRVYDGPVLVDNDANLGALAESWWGLGKGLDDLAYVKLGTGIGSGHILSGQIYRGAHGVAGEIGHVSIDRDGPSCVCGLHGCLVSYIGAKALVDRVHQLRDEYPNSILAEPNPSGIEALVQASLQGDTLAQRVVEESGRHLGVALATMVNLLNPSIVVLGGGLSRAGEQLLAPLRATLSERAPVSSHLALSQLGERASGLGAATLVLQQAMSDHRLFSERSAPMRKVV